MESTEQAVVIPPPIPPQVEGVVKTEMGLGSMVPSTMDGERPESVNSTVTKNDETGEVGGEGTAASTDGIKQEITGNEVKKEAEEEVEKPPPKKPKKTNTLVVNCANCNTRIEEVEIQVGRDVELDRLLNETLMTPLTMEVCEDEKQNDKITATVEITMFEALIEIFSLRSKSPHLLPLLERVMKKNSIENANALGLGADHGKTAQDMKLLSLCDECTSRIASLYELYKEFTLLSMKSNAFFSRIVGSSASGSFAKSNIINVPVTKPQPKPASKQQVKIVEDDGPIIPEVYIDDGDDSDYGNQTYSHSEDNDDSRSYTMDVETVYGADNSNAVKFKTSTKGRAIVDHSSKGSGMYADASGSTSRRGEIKRKCNRCGKTYYYTTSYEKHMQTCMGPSTFFSDEGDDDVAILPDGDDSADYQLYNSGPSSAKKVSFSPLPTVSTPQEIRAYQCKYCPKVCQSPANLQRHERTHGTGSSPGTTCKPCGRTFGSMYDLRRHYQTNVHKQRIRQAGGAAEIDDDVIEGDWIYY